jgi:hypothetical protein
MEDMIRMLADAPEEQRKAMMKSRFEMLAAMAEDQRLNGMSEMITAVTRLPEAKRKQMIGTRNLVVAEFPPATRDAIMKSRIQLAMRLPKDVNDLDMMTMMQALPALPENLRMTFMNSTKAHMQEAGMPMPQIPGMLMAESGAKVAAPAPSAPSGPREMLKAQEDMMRQLAAASDDMRRNALKMRFGEILKGSDDTAAEAIKVMMEALSRLPDEQRGPSCAQGQRFLALPDSDLKRVMAARVMGMKTLQKLDNEDKMITMEEAPWMPQGPRMKFMDAMNSSMKQMGLPLPPMPSTPMHHGRPMEKRGLFSKSWTCVTCSRKFPA